MRNAQDFGILAGMHPETAILLTLVAYKVALIGVGLALHGRSKSGVDFFLAGRGLGGFVAGLSASASSSSAWTLLGVSGLAYQVGLSSIWILPSCVGGFVLNWFVLAPALRRRSAETGAVTVTDMLLLGEGSRAAKRGIVVVASALIVFAFSAYVGAQFGAAGSMLADTFKDQIVVDRSLGICLGALVVLLYTSLGGFWAASVTDSIQGLMMAAACILLPLAALIEVGGFGTLLDKMAQVEVLNFNAWFGSASGPLAIGLVVGSLGIGLGYPGQPHVVNRMMAIRSEAALSRARVVAIVWAVFVYSGMLVLGWCGRVLVAELDNGESIFVSLAGMLLSPVVAGILLAAVLSAMMSTADSQLLVAASSITHDLRIGQGSAWSLVARSRLTIVVVTIGALIAALRLDASVFRSVLFGWNALGAAFGPPLLVTVLRGAPSAKQTLGAILAGASLSMTAYWLPKESVGGSEIDACLERVLPFMVSLAFCFRSSGDRRPT